MSGVEIVGLISAIIGIIEVVKTVSDNLKDAANLPTAFREIGERLPIVQDTLRITKTHIGNNVDDEACQAMETVVKNCKNKAEQLQGIFNAVALSADASRIESYRIALRRWSKGKLVEDLAREMIEDVRVLAMNRAVQGATEAQVAQLLKAIEDLANVEPSLSDGTSVNQHHSGSGDNVAGNKYMGNHNENHGSGTAYFGSVTQQVTIPKEDPLQGLLDSLAFLNMDSRFNDIDLAARGTCDWLLRHKTYREWTRTNWALIWIKGKPGSGKSTLLRYARDKTEMPLQGGTGPLILSFFFHGRGHELQKTKLGLFRSLLHQVLTEVPNALLDPVAALRQWQGTTNNDSKEKQLKGFFESSLRRALETRPIWLFVDALDECGNDNAVELAVWFNSLLYCFPPSGLKQFRICFTSRHYPNVNLRGVLEIWVENENRSGIATFVEEKLSSFRVLTRSTIPDVITERANGVFLWVHLVVKKVLKLMEEHTELKEIEAAIWSVPNELEGLYLELIQSAGPRFLKLVQWICFATRPLSLAELRWGMILDADCEFRSLDEYQSAEQYYLSSDDAIEMYFPVLSCGLAELTTDAKVIQFIHQSVKDFFVDKGLSVLGGTTQRGPMAEVAHYRLAQICLHYLDMEEIKRSNPQKRRKTMQQFPFLHYASTSWIIHTRVVRTEYHLQSFTWPLESTIQQWVAIHRLFCGDSCDCLPEGTTLLHAVSKYGLVEALQTILKGPRLLASGIDTQDSLGQTPLSCAAKAGHEAIVAVLLDWRANIETPDEMDRTPLAWSIEGGYKAVTELLLRRGAKVDFDYVYPVEGDFEGLKIDILREVKKLKRLGGMELAMELSTLAAAGSSIFIAAGAAAANAGASFATLGAATCVGVGLLSILRERRSDIWRTPLTRAAEMGDLSISRLLLEHHARPDLGDREGYTPLERAEEGDNIEVVNLLLGVEASSHC